MSGENIQVCLLLDNIYLNKYLATAIENMLKKTSAKVNLLILNDEMGNETSGRLHNLYNKFNTSLSILKKHRIWAPVILKRELFPPEYAKDVHICQIDGLSNYEVIRTTPIQSEGFGNRFPDGVINTISEETDIVFRFGFGIIKGDILNATEYGVLSFHHGDIRKYRGRAGGFWAYLNGDKEAGVTLQVLTEDLDGGKIAKYESVKIEDDDSFKDIRTKIHCVSESMLVDVIFEIQTDEFSPNDPVQLGDLYTRRNYKHITRFTLKELKRRIR